MNNSFFKKKQYFIYILFFSLFISCSENEVIQIIDTSTAKEFRDVKYGESPEHIFDIYLPKNRLENTTKVLVLVHGGSWISGDKKDLKEAYETLKLKFPNYAIVNINYQLAGIGKSPFPMQINDIDKLIKNLKSKTYKYQISNKFAFIGVSAGAHLSMLYSYTSNNLNEVKMVCSIVGPTNFTDTNYVSNPDYSNFIAGAQLLTGVSYDDNVEYYKNVSPFHVVTSKAPPTILFYGGKDELIPSSQGIEMHAKLNDLGVVNEFTFYENEGHGWEGENLVDTYNKLESFIKTHF